MATKVGIMQKLQIEYIPAVKLHHLPGNARKLKDKQGIEKLRGLIRSHGFRNPLEVWQDESGRWVIIAGNHRFRAGKMEGMTEFPCLIFSGTRQQAEARALSDNASNEWTAWDMELRDLQLADLKEQGIDTTFTGIDFELPGLEDLDNLPPPPKKRRSKSTEAKPPDEPPAGQNTFNIFVMLDRAEYIKWKALRGNRTDKKTILDLMEAQP